MAEVRPFRGVLYNPTTIKNIAGVVAPPYDMISPEAQKILHDRDRHNIVRLILGYQHPEDTGEENRYTRAAATLREWLRRRILERDEEKAIYRYDQEYTLPRGGRLSRRGFIALAGLEELDRGTIHPHEKTLSGPKEDRLKLMMATHANFSQIFSFYDDPRDEVDKVLNDSTPTAPRYDFTDEARTRHILWTINDPEAHAAVGRLMANKVLFIADGHHRYETALNFRRVMRQERGRGSVAGYDYVMMYFANMSGTGLTILPFHRMVTLPEGADLPSAVGRLGELAELSPVIAGSSPKERLTALLEAMAGASRDEHRFGLYAPLNFYLMRCRRRHEPKEDPVADLDVSFLHRILLPAALGDHAEAAPIQYLTGEEEILQVMGARERRLIFFLNPTRVEQVRDIAAAGLRMPPKSTNFHPKLISGLVLNLLD